jgi:uncharacterized protein YjaZ
MADNNSLKIIQYKTIKECLEAFYFNTPLDQVPDGFFCYQDADGNEFSIAKDKAIEMIKKRNAWGWVENKEIIHIFIKKKAPMLEVVEMLAHEIGHLQRPFHKSLKEEKKANLYAKVAVTALAIALELKKKES